jgi:predicted ester cyclase
MALIANELVERFYHRVWNRRDEIEAQRILDGGFHFRGSLGPELRGPGAFIAYMRSVNAALEDFTCQIDDVIASADRAAARMTFHGRHRGKFFGIEPTGREVRWSGAAFFKTRDSKIIELWVLGDVEAIRRQLEPQRTMLDFQI